MVFKIDMLIKEVYQEKLAQKNAELEALQSQINPHFLYNTLDTINWMLLEKKEYEISGIVVSLGEMMKYAISRSSRTVAPQGGNPPCIKLSPDSEGADGG